jgi:septal ring factor EnvC (AmiA/AmiB activator)
MNTKIKNMVSSFFVLWAICLTFVLVDISAAEKESLIEVTRSQIKELEKHLSEQQDELLSVNIKERDILGEIERLEMELAKNREALRELSGQIEEIEEAIQDGQRSTRALNRSLRVAEGYFHMRLKALYKYGRSGYVRLLMSSESLQEFERTVKYMKSIMDQDRVIFERIEKQSGKIESELARLAENKAALEVLKKARGARTMLVERYIESKVFLLMKAHEEKEFYAKAVGELKEASQALNQTLKHLGSEEGQRALPQGFAHMKGKLPLPLEGRIVKHVTGSGSSPFMHHKGVFIAGSPGQEVKSIFPGRIDYSDWFKGYGQLMIINHGAHYYTVFAHLEERIKDKDEIVSGGEPVGIAGDPGWNLGTGVYFEIRRGGEHLDPERWLGVQ